MGHHQLPVYPLVTHPVNEDSLAENVMMVEAVSTASLHNLVETLIMILKCRRAFVSSSC